MSKRVIIFRDGLLSYSETFVKSQAIALKQWIPILVGHKTLKKSLDYSNFESQLIIPKGTFFLHRLIYMFYRLRNKAYPFGVRQLKALNADLIHAHFGTSAVDFYPYARELKIPMLVTLHGFDISIYREWWEAGKRGTRKRNYPNLLCAMAKDPLVHFLAVSKAIKERAIKFGIPEEKISISYIGVDTENFTPSGAPVEQRPNRIIYVGRLVEKKGAGILIDAFSKIKAKIPDAELAIVGRGPLGEKLQEQVAALGIEGVNFIGALTNSEVKTEISRSKIFCLPSITAVSGDAEGLPISILEAQASGVFVATSSSGGVGDNLIDQKTCFTFAEKDSNALADILIELLSNTEAHLPILSEQRQVILDNFNLTTCAEKLEEFYDLHAQGKLLN